MSLVQRWLREASQPYTHANQVYNDVDQALASHPTVRPKTDVYTYDDGRAELLLCVHGLLPISFRGVSYNIPIAIWIQHGYPREAPIVYVVPTSDMLVKPSKSVDPSGRCSFPYLEVWEHKSEACSLRELLDIMQEHFSREPPLYAKSKQTVAPSESTSQPVSQVHPPIPSTSTSLSPRPLPRPGIPPPRPQSMIDSREMGAPITNHQFRPVPPPPIPPHQIGGNPPVPRPQVPSPPQALNRPQNMAAVYAPPPLTPSPPQAPPPPTRMGHASTQSLPSFTPSPIAPQQANFQPQPVQASPPTQPQWQSPVPPPIGQSFSPAGQSPPLNAPPPPPSSYIPSPGISSQAASTPSLPARAPVPNLMDEEIVADPIPPAQPAPPPVAEVAPPRPMNPQLVALHAQLHEKLTNELNKFAASLAKDSEAPRTAQADLLKGEPAIKDEMARLESVRDVCRTVAGRLSAVVGAAEGAIGELKRKGDPEVDELVCATNIVHNQLINLVAEDHAIEDTIYHLHRALNEGRLDLDRFLKTTTRLAEEQFMKRALIEKITSQLPMGLRVM